MFATSKLLSYFNIHFCFKYSANSFPVFIMLKKVCLLEGFGFIIFILWSFKSPLWAGIHKELFSLLKAVFYFRKQNSSLRDAIVLHLCSEKMWKIWGTNGICCLPLKKHGFKMDKGRNYSHLSVVALSCSVAGVGWAMPPFPHLGICPLFPAPAGFFSPLPLFPWGTSHVVRGLRGSGTGILQNLLESPETSIPTRGSPRLPSQRLCCRPWAQMPCPSGRGVRSPCTASPRAVPGARFIKSVPLRLQWGWGQPLSRAVPAAALRPTASAGWRQHKPDLWLLLCNSSVVVPPHIFASGVVDVIWRVNEHHRSLGLCCCPVGAEPRAVPLLAHGPFHNVSHFAWEQQQEVQEMFEFEIKHEFGAGSGSKITIEVKKLS